MLKEDGPRYNEMMNSIAGSERKKKQSAITQNFTHSMIALPMVDVQPAACTPASVHIILGMTVWFVKAMRRLFWQIEALEAESLGTGNVPAQLQERVEASVEMANDYESYLLKRFGSKIEAVNAQQTMIEYFYEQMSCHEQMMNISVNPYERSIWMECLRLLREHQQAAEHVRGALDKEQVENEFQLMEQLFVTAKVKEEMLTILKKHKGHASRVVAIAMGNNGVDKNVYHKGSIDGNHCMKLGENGTAIVNELTAEMTKVIKDDKNIEYLEKLDSSLKEMFNFLFEMM